MAGIRMEPAMARPGSYDRERTSAMIGGPVGKTRTGRAKAARLIDGLVSKRD